MHLPDKQPDYITDISSKLRGLTQELLQGLEPCAPALNLPQAHNLFADQPNTRLFLVEEGQLRCEYQGKVVYLVEPGDLIGLPRSLQLPVGTMTSDEPLRLLPYDRDQLIHHVNGTEALQKHWTYYLICISSFYREALAQEMRSHFQPSTGFLHFESGDTIIAQGDDADCVYTMLEGSADAIHNGVKVGEVHAEEIFGALAVFTRQSRTASVVATDHCTVMAVRKEDFIDLIGHQPQVCLSLIEEMADKINLLNSKVLELQPED